jgi:MOSC N-terminal beta barrel domain
MSDPQQQPWSASGRVVGRVAALWRYPVKSMRGEPVPEAAVSWHGLAGDRRWAFVRDGQARNGFPWLTLRERPDLLLYQPSFAEPDLPNLSPTMVRTPSGDLREVTEEALAAELGDGVRVMKLDRGAFDTMPLSVLTHAGARRPGRAAWRGARRPALSAQPAGGRRGRERVSRGRLGGLGVAHRRGADAGGPA